MYNFVPLSFANFDTVSLFYPPRTCHLLADEVQVIQGTKVFFIEIILGIEISGKSHQSTASVVGHLIQIVAISVLSV